MGQGVDIIEARVILIMTNGNNSFVYIPDTDSQGSTCRNKQGQTVFCAYFALTQ